MSASMTVEQARDLLARQSARTALPTQATPPVRHCRCGQTLTPGLRCGPGSTQTRVLICWDCGYEEPPLYSRSGAERNGARGVTSKPTRTDRRLPPWRF